MRMLLWAGKASITGEFLLQGQNTLLGKCCVPKGNKTRDKVLLVSENLLESQVQLMIRNLRDRNKKWEDLEELHYR